MYDLICRWMEWLQHRWQKDRLDEAQLRLHEAAHHRLKAEDWADRRKLHRMKREG